MIEFKKLYQDAIVPTRAHETDAGFDLYYRGPDLKINPRDTVMAPTGMAIAIPPGVVGLVCPRSGLAAKFGLTVLNAPGIIDSGFRGEMQVILHNAGKAPILINNGERVAQLVVTAHYHHAREVGELPAADRGTNGFGSTGR